MVTTFLANDALSKRAKRLNLVLGLVGAARTRRPRLWSDCRVLKQSPKTQAATLAPFRFTDLRATAQNTASHMCDTMSVLRELGMVLPRPTSDDTQDGGIV